MSDWCFFFPVWKTFKKFLIFFWLFASFYLLDAFNPCIYITISKLGSYPWWPALCTYTSLYLIHFKFHFSAVANDPTSLCGQYLIQRPLPRSKLFLHHIDPPLEGPSQSMIPFLLYPSKLHKKMSYSIHCLYTCLDLFSTQVNPISLKVIYLNKVR